MNPMWGLLIGVVFGLIVSIPFLHAAWESDRDFQRKNKS